MSVPTADPARPALLFNWDAPRSRKAAFAGFVSASLLLHAACFYLFQVVYPAAVVLLPPPARVQLITPATEEGRTLLRWIDAEDPAFASATQRPPEAKQRALPRPQHVPSYLVEAPRLKQIPPPVPDTRAPSVFPPGPVPTLRRQPAPAAGVVPSRASFSSELAVFKAPTLPAPRFVASTSESPRAARFRIGLSRTGEVRHCFLMESSGDPALDEQAREHLSLARFPQAPAPSSAAVPSMVWGTATVDWGNDVTHPPTTSKSVSLQ